MVDIREDTLIRIRIMITSVETNQEIVDNIIKINILTILEININKIF